MRSFVYAVTAYLCLFLLSQAANAVSVDVSPAAAEVVSTGFAIGAVGGAVLLIWVAVGVLRYVREVMGVGAPSAVPFTQTREFKQQAYLRDLEARLAAEDAANGVEWRDVDGGKSNLDYEAGFRAEIEAAGSDPVLYDKYRLDDATHEEALRWSNKESNAEIKMPAPGAGWDSGEIKMPVLGPGWR